MSQRYMHIIRRGAVGASGEMTEVAHRPPGGYRPGSVPHQSAPIYYALSDWLPFYLPCPVAPFLRSLRDGLAGGRCMFDR